MIRHEKLQLVCHNTTNIHVLQQKPVNCYLLLYCVIFTFFALSYHIDLWFITLCIILLYPHPLGAPGTRAFTQRPPITYTYIYIYIYIYIYVCMHYITITLQCMLFFSAMFYCICVCMYICVCICHTLSYCIVPQCDIIQCNIPKCNMR